MLHIFLACSAGSDDLRHISWKSIEEKKVNHQRNQSCKHGKKWQPYRKQQPPQLQRQQQQQALKTSPKTQELQQVQKQSELKSCLKQHSNSEAYMATHRNTRPHCVHVNNEKQRQKPIQDEIKSQNPVGK